eukprot:14298062-Alexandrium_andersonii.AAC.1
MSGGYAERGYAADSYEFCAIVVSPFRSPGSAQKWTASSCTLPSGVDGQEHRRQSCAGRGNRAAQ